MSKRKIGKGFQDPGAIFRPAPFWFWNHELTDKELIWQIREMRDKGMGGFFMHARHGLKTPYLSKEWMDRTRASIEEAKTLGMKAWLYDEDNWPSGTASGRVIKENPAYRMSALHVGQEWEVKGNQRIEKKLEVEDGLYAVLAIPLEGDKLIGVPDEVLDITKQVKDSMLTWKAPRGNWKVISLVRNYYRAYFIGGYVDTLNKDAIKRFIELTHRVYVEEFRDYMPEVVPGIFTDEPSGYYSGIKGSLGIPWTDSLPEEFSLRCDYDLKRALPALFFDVGPETAKVRCDFYETFTQMYIAAFHEQIYGYCDQFDLSLVGHPNSEGELFNQIKQHGDIFRLFEYMHYAGVDHLFEETWPAEGFSTNNLVGPKFVSSAGHLFQKPHVMSEAFGVAGQWKINLRTLKWLGDWQVALGINYFCQHAFYYSLQGFRKTECPPGEFYQSPFWPYYKIFADHLSRLSYVFTEGRHIAPVAVLYPNKSMWSYMNPGPTEETKNIEESLNEVSALLLKHHYDYDYISEEFLQKASFKGGRIKIDDEGGKLIESYELLVMPNCTTVSQKTLDFIGMFSDRGGKIIALETLPTLSIEKGEDSTIVEGFSDLFGEGVYKWIEDNEEGVWKNDKGSAILIKGLDSNKLGETLSDLCKPDVVIEDERGPIKDIVYLHYLRDGLHFYLFVNTSRGNTRQARITLSQKGLMDYWDTFTGEMKPFYQYNITSRGVEFELEFEPTQCYLFSLEPKRKIPEDRPFIVEANVKVDSLERDGDKHELSVSVRDVRRGYAVVKMGEQKNRFEAEMGADLDPIILRDEWRFKTEKPNALPLREWVYRHSMYSVSRGFYQTAHRYETTILVEEVPNEARLMLDGEMVDKVWRGSSDPDIRISINGGDIGQVEGGDLFGLRDLSAFKEGKYLDHYTKEVDIGDFIQPGENKIVITSTNVAGMYETSNLTEPPILIGHFALHQQDGRWVIGKEGRTLRTGSWADQGYPYYSGTGIYEQKINIGAEYLNQKLILQFEKVADLVEVWVNGERVGVIPWEPWEIDISDFAKEGENTITLKIANSLDNLFSDNKLPSGLLGEVQIVPYRRLRWEW